MTIANRGNGEDRDMFAIIDAQGWYGSHTTVQAVYADATEAASAASAANLAARRGEPRVTVVQLDSAEVGERIHSTDATRYERASRATFAGLADAQRDRLVQAEAAGTSDRYLDGMRERLALLECWS